MSIRSLQHIREVEARDDLIQQLMELNDKYRHLAAACYVGLGSEHDLPEEWLDALNNAANGQPFNVDNLLPYRASGTKSIEQKQYDADFIDWLADRLVYVYGEPDNVDFVLKCRRLAEEQRK